MQSVVHYVRRMFHRPPAEPSTDQQLLEAFCARRDENAFTTLVHRHGPIVWGVCRRSLGQTQDAEDAFQATFLVLARRAAGVAWHDDITGWLLKVAVHVCRKAREQARRQVPVAEAVVNTPETSSSPEPDLSAVLDEEIQRLPEKYRAPVLLCYLQGKTYTEAAQVLGWKEGTVSGRLARARDLLRARLQRRGLAPATAVLLTMLEGVRAAEAAPTALLGNTIRRCLASVAGQLAPPDPTTALTEGVLRSMFLNRLKTLALVTFFLGMVGVGLGLGARHLLSSADPERDEDGPRPLADVRPLVKPRDWEGRWIDNPFADATSFEITHQGRGASRVYLINDPDAVAELIRAARLEAAQNGFAVGLVPPARIKVHRKKLPPLEISVLGEEQFQFRDGVAHLSPDFLASLNRRLSKQEQREIDVSQSLPAPPAPPPGPVVKPSRASLLAGFTELEVTYLVAGRAHRARITDRPTLDALHRELKLIGQQPALQEKTDQRGLKIVSKDGSTLHASVLDGEHVVQPEVGRFQLTPAFLKALSQEVSRREGWGIDITATNPLPEKQAERALAFRKLLAGAKSLRFTIQGDEERTFTVSKPEELTPLLQKVTVLHVPQREEKAERQRPLAELTDAEGKKTTLTLIEASPALETGPVLADLIEVTGLGRLWIDNQWKYQLPQIASLREQTEKAKRDAETARLVCHDFPTFLRHVRNVVVHYREQDSEITGTVKGDQSRHILGALAEGKLEKLDWNEERWQKEIGTLLDAGAGTLDLTPGLGFSLMLVVQGKRELLVYPHGRLVFAKSPEARLQRAIDPDNPRKVELLPRAK